MQKVALDTWQQFRAPENKFKVVTITKLIRDRQRAFTEADEELLAIEDH